jgi:hypothetical protein
MAGIGRVSPEGVELAQDGDPEGSDMDGDEMAVVKWDPTPAGHDYPAAADYLSLLFADPVLRAELAQQLAVAPIMHYKAKDLLRASQLPLLTTDNAHVAADLKQIRKRRALSPVLLVRGDLLRGFPLQIADGYHRVCASYYVNENTDIPCRLIDVPVGQPSRSGPVRQVVRDAGQPTVEPPTGSQAAGRATHGGKGAPTGRRRKAATKTATVAAPSETAT